MANRAPGLHSGSHSDPYAIWQRAREILRASLDRETFATWFADIHAIEIRGGVLHVGAPSVIKLQTLRGSYYPQLAAAVREAAGRPIEIELRVAQQPEPAAAALEPRERADAGAETSPGRSHPVQPARSRPVLKETATFDRFVQGASNQIAVAAARRVASHPGRDANPLFIYSASGLGKTHLLHAIAHRTLQERYTVLVDAEQYVRQFVASVGAGERAAFQEKYESAEVLIVDDIQKIAGKTQTQDEFFNVFNALHHLDRQIVIASDVPPRRLSGLSERLVTRFAGGLVVEINPPDLELRIAILQRTLRDDDRGPALDEQSVQLIAERGGVDVRTLLGALKRVRMTAEFERTAVTPAFVLRALSDHAAEAPRKTNLTVADLIAAAADVTGVAPDLFTSARKDQRTARARQIVMYLAATETELSLSVIGEALGGRDHSTVLHGRNKVTTQLGNPGGPNAQWWIQRVSEIRSRLHL